jgi:hypothetical protein
MFIRLFVERNDPKSQILINVDNIRSIGAIQADGASPKCVLWFAKDHSVTVDEKFDTVVSLLEKATGSLIHPPAPCPTHGTGDVPRYASQIAWSRSDRLGSHRHSQGSSYAATGGVLFRN